MPQSGSYANTLPQREFLALVAASLLLNLVYLNFGHNQFIREADEMTYSPMAILVLSMTLLGPIGAQLLAESMPPVLDVLGLWVTGLDDEALIHLAPALTRTLKNVSLECNPFTDTGAALLAEHLPDERDELSVNWVQLSDESMDSLRAKVSSTGQCENGFELPF
ncbi:hypothetical protein H9P43_009020 [Blastocladiella emersonii ATCC 22665]|nr:hypothetical protein H9P43_009020 [Blastocladiella emersonii ATCC 22665]